MLSLSVYMYQFKNVGQVPFTLTCRDRQRILGPWDYD